MDEKDFELLTTLYELKNITKTAQKLYLSQPSLTKRIQNIENELHCQLLVRTSKGILFTPTGESLIPYASQILATSRILREQAAAMQTEICGTLRIGVPQNFAYYHLPALLKQYNQLYPKVSVQMEIGQSRKIHQMILNDEISVAVVRGEYDWKDGIYLHSTESLYLVCSHDNIGRPLDSYPYICRMTEADLDFQIQKWLKEHNYDHIKPFLRIDSTDICKEMVRYGLGWSILASSRLNNFDGYKEELISKNGNPLLEIPMCCIAKFTHNFLRCKNFLTF